ncbi:MAG: S8 family serine peptidase, partial [Gemmatimonadetes bacterium]|nr:S8 family serine peptidase [Gemmatimonadota bacterium]
MSRRIWLIAPLALFLASCQDSPDAGAPTAPAVANAALAETSLLGPELEAALADAAATDTFEVVVNYDETLTTLDAVTSSVLQLGAGVIQFRHLSMLASLATKEQILAMQTLAGLQSIYLNRELRYLNAEGRGSINADDVHALGITGKGVGIAILDTGIDGGHPDVAFGSKTVQNVKHVANLRDAYYFEGKINGTIRKGADLYIEDVENTETSVGHGTHVAGTAAGSGAASDGKYTGVAPGAHLIGLGAGDVLFVFWILSGFDYIIDHQREYNIQVVNNSWGSSGLFDPDDPINEA